MDEDRGKCPVCAYDFSLNSRIPKLLPCNHTLCILCIENILMTNEDSEDRAIKCPICRERSNVPPEGIRSFLDNYFVTAKTKLSACDLCENDTDDLTECSVCNSSLCSTCYTSHQSQHSKKSESEPDSDENQERDSRFLRWARKRYEKSVPTLFVAHPLRSFACECSRCVRKILPMGKGSWILSNTPLLTYFDNQTGKSRRVECHGTNVVDICKLTQNSLVFVDSEGKVFKWNANSTTKTLLFTIPLGTNATALYVKAEEYIILAIQKDRVDDEPTKSFLKTFDLRKNSFVETNQVMEKELRLRYVTSIDVHPQTGSRYFCDYDQQCVVILAGYKIERYEGKLSIPKIEHTEDNLCIGEAGCKFRPRTLCCDDVRNTLVYDVGTKSIHVIDENACNTGVVFFDTLNPVGDPNCFTIDKLGHLWVGDRHSGTVKVYSMDKFLNIYDGGDTGELSLGDLGIGSDLRAFLSNGPLAIQRNPDGSLGLALRVSRVTDASSSSHGRTGTLISGLGDQLESAMRLRDEHERTMRTLVPGGMSELPDFLSSGIVDEEEFVLSSSPQPRRSAPHHRSEPGFTRNIF